MKIIFAGTPDFAATHLQALLNQNHDVIAVYTQPDKPKGRGHKLAYSPVKEIALQNNIPVYQPLNFKNEEDVKNIQSLNADLMIVVAYGVILPLSVINATKLGCINVHGSLLPKWRGAAPIQRSLLNGDKKTGVTIMKIVPQLDAGDMLLQSKIEIENNDTSESLYLKLEKIGSETLLHAINNIEDLLRNAQKQDETIVTYATKLTKEEALLDFSKPAEQLDREVRGYNPWPMSYFNLNELTIKVEEIEILNNNSDLAVGTIVNASKYGLDIQTGNGIIRIKKMQLPGKKMMNFGDIFNSKKELFNIGSNLCQK